MTFVSSLDLLYQRLQKLITELNGLRTMVMEDKPDDSSAQPEAIGEITDDLLGWLQESLNTCQQARKAVDYPLNLALAQHQLYQCQNSFDRVLHRFFVELARYDRIIELVRVGRSRGSAWQRWSAAVRRTLDACYLPLFDVHNAFRLCWQEFMERGASVYLSAHAITIHLAKGS